MERPKDLHSRSQNREAERAGAGWEQHRPHAAIRENYWPWIWAVPIAAAAIVVWLLVRHLSQGGTDITIALPTADGVSNQTNVTLRGVKIGAISDVKLAKDQKSVMADVHIDSSADNDLRSESKFYLENAKPNFADLSSLKSVIVGPNLVLVPGGGQPTTHFTGIVGAPPDRLAAPVTYAASFVGDVGGLQPGNPVTYRGFRVGEIDRITLASDAAAGQVTTKVLFTLDAARFHFGNGDRSAATLNELMGKLVGRGLRAELTQDPPLVGATEVTLDMVNDAPPATLETSGPYPVIPADEDAGIQALIAKLGKLPVAEIGENVRSITAHVNLLVSSGRLKDMIAKADQTTAELDKVVHQAGPQVGPTISDLRKTASELDAAAATAKQMMGGSVTAPEGNLQQSLRELTDASRAVRSLADYLDQHPESLIKGR
ncbi:MAG TPA: MlaD family protein [Rhizomicrobium sp.]|nr:MlaD family protein [Rhizomicrobium sp.]